MESKKELGLVGSLDNCWDSLYLKHKLFFNEIPAEFKTKCFVNCKLIFNKSPNVLFDIEKLQINDNKYFILWLLASSYQDVLRIHTPELI